VWSPDGRQIVSGSLDHTVRVWNAEGTGAPLVLHGHEDNVGWTEWSPDGRHIVSSSKDKTVRVWSDLVPLHGADDPKLWAASSYCMSVERRVALLSVPEAAAHADQDACQRRVAAAAAGHFY
jgi:hypothetical protein